MRKTIFSLRLWKPRRQRAHSQRRWLVDSGRPCHGNGVGLVTGCINARRSITRLIYSAARLSTCHHVVGHRRDVAQGCESAALKRSTQTGYKYVEAALVISTDAAMHDVNFQNHGGLAIVYCNTVVFQKRKLNICVSTFEYLYGYATTKCGQFILFGVYRPGSQAL